MKKWIALLCRWALAAVFIAAALPKILSPHDFALVVFRYQMLPYPLVNLFALWLPWIELFAAIALLIAPRLRDAALFLIGGMLVVFTVAIGFNLYRGVDMACGCFSVNPTAHHMGALNLARNIGLLLLTAVATWTGLKPGQTKMGTPPPASST